MIDDEVSIEIEVDDEIDVDVQTNDTFDIDLTEVQLIAIGRQVDLAEDDTKSFGHVLNRSTKHLKNEGEDGSSPYATKDFVKKNGGKIDSISIDGEPQKIDENKNVNIDLSGKVDKSKTPKTIYGVDEKGNQISLAYENANNTPNTIVGRDENGNIQIQTPKNSSDATPKQYVDKLADTKLDKNTTISGNRVYASQTRNVTKEDGTTTTEIVQTTVGYASGEQANTLALRNSTGAVGVGNPTANAHAVPKLYAEQNFVQQVKTETNLPQAYVKNEDGSQSVLNIDKWGVDADSIPQRTGAGTIRTFTPTSDNDATNKKYVDDNFIPSKTETFSNVEGKAVVYNQDGNQGIMLVARNSADPYTIVRRNDYGAVKTGTPQADDDASTKKYVDDIAKSLAGQNEYIGSYDGTDYTAETIQTILSDFVQANENREKRGGDLVNIVNVGTDADYSGQQWIYSQDAALWKYYIDFENHSVIDNLTSDSSIDGLAAKQGKQLKSEIDEINKNLTENYVKNTDYATDEKAGIARWVTGFGLKVDAYGRGTILKATNDEISAKTQQYKPIVPANQDFAFKMSFTDNKLTWTEEEKEKARQLVGIAIDDYYTKKETDALFVETENLIQNTPYEVSEEFSMFLDSDGNPYNPNIELGKTYEVEYIVEGITYKQQATCIEVEGIKALGVDVADTTNPYQFQFTTSSGNRYFLGFSFQDAWLIFVSKIEGDVEEQPLLTLVSIGTTTSISKYALTKDTYTKKEVDDLFVEDGENLLSEDVIIDANSPTFYPYPITSIGYLLGLKSGRTYFVGYKAEGVMYEKEVVCENSYLHIENAAPFDIDYISLNISDNSGTIQCTRPHIETGEGLPVFGTPEVTVSYIKEKDVEKYALSKENYTKKEIDEILVKIILDGGNSLGE